MSMQPIDLFHSTLPYFLALQHIESRHAIVSNFIGGNPRYSTIEARVGNKRKNNIPGTNVGRYKISRVSFHRFKSYIAQP